MADKKLTKDAIVKALHNLNFGTDAEKNAALNGAEMVMLITDNGALFNEMMQRATEEAKIKFLQEQVLEYASEERRKRLEYASYIFDSQRSNPDAFNTALESVRGIVMGAAKVDLQGRCCDNAGHPAEDLVYNVEPGKTIAPWGTTKYYDFDTEALMDTATSNSEKVDVMCVTLSDLSTPLYVTKKDVDIVAAGIRKDIAEHETVLERYAAETGRDITTGKDTGKAGAFRDIIAESARNSHFPEYSGSNEMLAKMISGGYVQCAQHLMIGTMETLCRLDEVELRKASEADVKRYLALVLMFGITADDEQKRILTDDALDTYRDDKGVQLTGLDDAGKTVSGSANTTASKRRYIRALGSKVAFKLHSALVINNNDTHPLRKQIIKFYADTNA